jgi:hypothetical protein
VGRYVCNRLGKIGTQVILLITAWSYAVSSFTACGIIHLPVLHFFVFSWHLYFMSGNLFSQCTHYVWWFCIRLNRFLYVANFAVMYH